MDGLLLSRVLGPTASARPPADLTFAARQHVFRVRPPPQLVEVVEKPPEDVVAPVADALTPLALLAIAGPLLLLLLLIVMMMMQDDG